MYFYFSGKKNVSIIACLYTNKYVAVYHNATNRFIYTVMVYITYKIPGNCRETKNAQVCSAFISNRKQCTLTSRYMLFFLPLYLMMCVYMVYTRSRRNQAEKCCFSLWLIHKAEGTTIRLIFGKRVKITSLE